MRKKLLLSLLLIYSVSVFGQNYSKDAESFFRKFKTNAEGSSFALENFPSLEDCKYVFKGNAIYTYYAKVTEIKKTEESRVRSSDQIANVVVESFTTEDMILKSKNDETVKMIKESFQPGVTFYMVSLRKSLGTESGNTFKYFVYLNCRWVIFPKPMLVLSDKAVEELK